MSTKLTVYTVHGRILDSGALAVHSTVNNWLYSWHGTRLEILFSSSECREVMGWPATPDQQSLLESEI